MHRPAPATVISLIALFFAMSGTAYAATGGDFLLGKSNTATAVTSLTNSKGTALSLASTSTTPPFEVSNSVQVPKLNASELGGTPASGFLGVDGTAANSTELGGTPASGFIQGGGTISDGRQSLSSGTSAQLVSAPGSYVEAYCVSSGDDYLYLYGTSGSAEIATWWSPQGAGQADIYDGSGGQNLDNAPGTAALIVQVDTGSNISTYTLAESGACQFTGQVVNSNG